MNLTRVMHLIPHQWDLMIKMIYSRRNRWQLRIRMTLPSKEWVLAPLTMNTSIKIQMRETQNFPEEDHQGHQIVVRSLERALLKMTTLESQEVKASMMRTQSHSNFNWQNRKYHRTICHRTSTIDSLNGCVDRYFYFVTLFFSFLTFFFGASRINSDQSRGWYQTSASVNSQYFFLLLLNDVIKKVRSLILKKGGICQIFEVASKKSVKSLEFKLRLTFLKLDWIF